MVVDEGHVAAESDSLHAEPEPEVQTLTVSDRLDDEDQSGAVGQEGPRNALRKRLLELRLKLRWLEKKFPRGQAVRERTEETFGPLIRSL